MINKIIKNIRWKINMTHMKTVGKDNKIGIDFTIHGNQYISIGNGFRGGKHIIIDAIDTYNEQKTGFTPEIIIGDNVSITDYCYISCANSICIGTGTLIGSNSFICDNFHGRGNEEEKGIMPSERMLYSKGGVTIGERVWIGRNVCVMPGVVIGNNVIIGANSVVTHDIPDDSIAAGVPAEIVRRI